MLTIQLVSFLTTLLVFGTIGYLVARKLKRPVQSWILVVIIVATVLVRYVGINTALASIFGFAIYLNRALQALGLGMMVNLLVRK